MSKTSEGQCSSEAIDLVQRRDRLDCDPFLAPNGIFQDAETNFVFWRPNWDNLKMFFLFRFT